MTTQTQAPTTWWPLVAGTSVKERAGTSRPVVDKATGDELGVVHDATIDEVKQASAAARAAQSAWAAMPATERGAILRRAGEIIGERSEELAELLRRESGSTQAKADGEVALSIGELALGAATALTVTGTVVPSSQPGRTNIIEREPVGTVALITGWNYPMHLAFRILAPALALGNAVILKPAPQTPLMGGLAWAEAFAEAGVPAGVFSVLPGDEAGPALVEDPDVDMIHFTGSTAVGQSIAKSAAATMKKVALELGGSNASVVLADADVELAAEKGAIATYVHQGQVCIATSRHIVVREVAKQYTEALVAHAAKLRVGDPSSGDVDLGPLVSEQEADRVRALVDGAVSAGATVAAGGAGEGPFVPATVVTDVPADSDLFQNETFGPVAAVTIAEDEDDAVRLANDTKFGLSAAVFTRDVAHGWEVARRIRAGMVHVNDMTALHESHVPFGGAGASGFGGMFGGPANIELFTEPRWISLQQ